MTLALTELDKKKLHQTGSIIGIAQIYKKLVEIMYRVSIESQKVWDNKKWEHKLAVTNVSKGAIHYAKNSRNRKVHFVSHFSLA